MAGPQGQVIGPRVGPTTTCETVDIAAFVRPGDTVLWGQGTGEPRTLTEALVAQRSRVGPVTVFLGAMYSDTLRPEYADWLRFVGIGGVGTNAALARSGVLDIIPCHLSAIPRLIEAGRLPVDVAFVQLSRPGPNGCHSLGLAGDYIRMAMRHARTVVAEVNDQVPYTRGDTSVHPDEIHHVVHSSRPPIFVGPPVLGPVERRIGEVVAPLIPDGATLQLGIGKVPHAVALALSGKNDLGLHCGVIGNWIVELVEAGVVTNARKPIDRGVSVAGAINGTRRLYNFVDDNPTVELHPISYTHDRGVLARLEALIAVNSAVEVDLTGQVNAETVGGSHIGTVGGQGDFVRAAVGSPAGRSIIALASTARHGQISRIVARLGDAVVTTPRSDADLVVTEHGVADLRGVPLRERARRLIAIADPPFRDELNASLGQRGGMC